MGQSKRALECGQVFSVPGEASDAECPEDCPFVAEDVSNHSAVCRFQCVPEGRCSAVNPDATIADHDDMICRGCQVEACEECAHNGEDFCKTCAPRYNLKDDGSCESEGYGVWIVIMVVGGLFVICTSAYCGQLCFRPSVNDDAVQRGIRDRWRSRNKPPIEETDATTGGARESLLEDPRAKPWPITTNLCRTPVAGPGLLLYFNFQCFLIIWTILVLIAWCVTASVSSWDLFDLGIRDAETPRDMW